MMTLPQNWILQSVMFLLISFCLTHCDRVPQHEAQLTMCIAEENATGEDILPKLMELEEVLIEQSWLQSDSLDDYNYLLRRLTSGETEIPSTEIAPYVRDFWFLKVPASIGSYQKCVKKLSNQFSAEQAPSIHQMHRVYETFGSSDTQTDVINLAGSITNEDFNSILYRGALLMEILRFIE